VTPFFDDSIPVYASLDVAKREAALDLIAYGRKFGGLTIVNPFSRP
jgi:hypothetical protein